MTSTTFSDLGLTERILRALRQRNYDTPTPIQAQAIPPLLEGRDILGIAQTGTGKTAAFALPILNALANESMRPAPNSPTALIMTPTRELEAQIGTCLRDYGRHLDFDYAVVFGGVSQVPQVRALRRGVDVLVATPGRLLDLMSQGHIQLLDVEIFVLDEADRMLDMGFVRDVQRVVDKLPQVRQSMLFSATMPPDVVRLTRTILTDSVRVEVAPQSTTADRIEQRVFLVEKQDKRKLLAEMLRDPDMERTLVFARTKHGANRISKHLQRDKINAAAIHGDKSQQARERALESFRRGKTSVLVATDIAARGIDVRGITHVVNFDLPNVPETYIHRIGRTARAGNDGVALSFCDESEREYLRDIERLLKRQVDVVAEHAHRSTIPMATVPESRKKKSGAARTKSTRRVGAHARRRRRAS